MFKHILIPTDGSPLAQIAIDQGFALAKEAGAKVTVVTVSEPFHVIASDVEDIAAGIADGLAIKRLGIAADSGLPGAGVVGIDPRQLHRHLAEHVLQLVDRPAVQGR